ncbi:hypothetical protein AB0F88_23595 [Streptosporangium sp. NPDC023963]|uniref:hypothetical protein n=1 Tax=Streptosporangium sp. NPDC023963 TaxID=3155608 RepID=UPI003447E52C
MAVLLASALDSISIHTGSEFLVTEVTADGEPVDAPFSAESLPGQPMISVGPNGVVIDSGSLAKSVIHVRYERWDGPPEQLAAWTPMWEGKLYLGSGAIGLVQYFYEGWDECLPFDTGVKEASWSVRVQTRRLTNTEEPDFPSDVVHGELYRVQLWP